MTRAALAAPEAAILVENHLRSLPSALDSLICSQDHLAAWGRDLARRLVAGRRLLVAGNGGSAAEAQHLSAEIVGRFEGEREPFSAIALHADTSAITAIGNDYGFEDVYARQVRAHGRPGDVLILLSTSGRSPNLLAAVSAAAEVGVSAWALTGPVPNPLADAVDDRIAIESAPAHVQECHLIAIHALCCAFDATVEALRADTLRRPT